VTSSWFFLSTPDCLMLNCIHFTHNFSYLRYVSIYIDHLQVILNIIKAYIKHKCILSTSKFEHIIFATHTQTWHLPDINHFRNLYNYYLRILWTSYVLIKIYFIISANNLYTECKTFNNPLMFLCRLYWGLVSPWRWSI
jgi:hypothetical protein